MNQVACPTSRQLTDFNTGKLSADEQSWVEQHLETCVPCQTALNTLATDNDTLIAELRCTPTMDAFTEESGCHRAIARIETLLTNQEATRDESSDSDTCTNPPPKTTKLGKYELIEQIGQGGMGAVYKARHTVLKKIVAVKLLPPHRLNNPQAVARFRREVEAAGALDHPHIVRASDADEANGQHFLVMDWLDGQDLARRVRTQGPLPIAEACELLRQAALGLDHAHRHGLVHRDVKPSNLLLTKTEDGRPTLKVLDLGLALLRDGAAPAEEDVTASGEVMGTYDFIAPEQALDAHTVDERADVYSLGCTAYFLLTGRVPFAGKSQTQKLLAHQTETPPTLRGLRPEVPAEVAALVDRMMAKDPDKRCGSMGEVAETLEQMSRNTAKPIPSARPRKRRSLPIAALLLLGLCATIGGTLAIIRISSDNGDYVIQTDDPDFAFQVSKGGVILEDRKGKRKYNLAVLRQDKAAGEFELEVTDPDNGLVFNTRTFTIKRGEKVALRAWFERGKEDPPAVAAARVEKEMPGGDFALAFDGRMSRVVIPSWKYKGDHPLTTEAWLVLNRPITDTTQETIMGDPEFEGIWIVIKGASSRFEIFTTGGAWVAARSIHSPPRNQLIHLAGVYDGSSEIRYYVDGQLWAREVAKGEYRPSIMPFVLGANPSRTYGFTEHFLGRMHEVRISNVARYSEDFKRSCLFCADGIRECCSNWGS